MTIRDVRRTREGRTTGLSASIERAREVMAVDIVRSLLEQVDSHEFKPFVIRGAQSITIGLRHRTGIPASGAVEILGETMVVPGIGTVPLEFMDFERVSDALLVHSFERRDGGIPRPTDLPRPKLRKPVRNTPVSGTARFLQTRILTRRLRRAVIDTALIRGFLVNPVGPEPDDGFDAVHPARPDGSAYEIAILCHDGGYTLVAGAHTMCEGRNADTMARTLIDRVLPV